MNTASDLTSQRCKPCVGGMPALSQAQADKLMQQIEGWQQLDQRINKTYHFKGYYQTIAFVNAIAWMAQREDHHPELTVNYNKCHVEYTTHAMGGLSENDFICAAKVDALLKT